MKSQNLLLIFAVLSGLTCALPAAPAKISEPLEDGSGEGIPGAIRFNAGLNRSVYENHVIADFSRYFARMFRQALDTENRYAQYDIVAGQVGSNALIAEKVRRVQIVLPEGLNADQGYAIETISSTLYVAASSEAGVANGLYDLLEQYGAYFQMSADALPERTEFAVKDISLRRKPAFKYRGIFPWDNFLCGMSGWNEEDYQDFIDKMVRMKYNLIQFHFYPDFAYYNESYATGETVRPGWIANPTPTLKTKGLIASSAFDGAATFGPREWIKNEGDPLKQAEACQAMLRRVIDYAHNRGLIVSLGFALMEPRGGTFNMTPKGWESIPLPMDEHNIDLQVERYNRLVSLYPNADIYWLWQSEGGGSRFKVVGPEPGYADMRGEHADWSTFSNHDGDGDIDYAYMFRELVKRLTPEQRQKLSTGGWDIQHIFPGYNDDIGKDIVFASLNNAYTAHAQRQMDNYSVARSGRRCWMIEWAEFDGNQWFPQFRIKDQESMYHKCLDFGVEAISLLTWKQSGLEQQFRYMTDFAWNPGLTADRFYADFCSKLYGDTAGAALVPMYNEYESIQFKQPRATYGDTRYCNLADGWTHLGVPTVPVTPAGLNEKQWRAYVDDAGTYKQEQVALGERNRKWIDTLNGLTPGMNTSQKFWARLMMNRLTMENFYLQAMTHLNSSFQVYDQLARKGNFAEAQTQAEVLAHEALTKLKLSIETYAEAILNTSDKGVVGQMNVQTYDVIRDFSRKISGHSPYATVDWTSFRLMGTSKLDHDFCATPWLNRDGVAVATVVTENGHPTQHLSIGGNNSQFNSLFITRDPISPSVHSYLDFRIRIMSHDPKDSVAIMFQLDDGSETWYQLDLLGRQNYVSMGRLPLGSLTDGQWHRVTWDLNGLVSGEIRKGGANISTLIIGNWDNRTKKPVVVEIQNLNVGKADTQY